MGVEEKQTPENARLRQQLSSSKPSSVQASKRTRLAAKAPEIRFSELKKPKTK